MSKAQIINFYPDDPVITAADSNANWSGVAAATLDINESNVRAEAVDIRQLLENPILLHQSFQTNGYSLGLNGNAPDVPGSEYYSYSDPLFGAGTLEQPIQTTSVGIKSSAPGLGTKLILNGNTGIHITQGDVVRIDFDINCWTIGEIIRYDAAVGYELDDVTGAGTMPAWPRNFLCSTYNQGGTVGGSGSGEWFYLAYPKLNITSGAALDADFETMGGALNNSAASFDPTTGLNVGLGAGLPLDAVAGLDATMIIPLHKINPYGANRPSFMPYFEGHRNQTYTPDDCEFDMPPMRLSHSVTMEFNALPEADLFAVQLYIGGIWRLAENAGALTMFLEDGTCDYLNFPDPLAYGLSTRIYLEECRVGIQILRGVQL